MDEEIIAQTVHEMNRGLQYALNDPMPSVPWQVESPDIRESAIIGVRAARELLAAGLDIGAAARRLHETWCETKTAQGWRYGPVKDPEAKTHPCLVDYGDLPPEQRLKDRLFLAAVREFIREEP